MDFLCNPISGVQARHLHRPRLRRERSRQAAPPRVHARPRQQALLLLLFAVWVWEFLMPLTNLWVWRLALSRTLAQVRRLLSLRATAFSRPYALRFIPSRTPSSPAPPLEEPS